MHSSQQAAQFQSLATTRITRSQLVDHAQERSASTQMNGQKSSSSPQTPKGTSDRGEPNRKSLQATGQSLLRITLIQSHHHRERSPGLRIQGEGRSTRLKFNDRGRIKAMWWKSVSLLGSADTTPTKRTAGDGGIGGSQDSGIDLNRYTIIAVVEFRAASKASALGRFF